MKSELVEKIARYFDHRSEVIAVYLFGSYAKGKQRKGSDVDLAILINRDHSGRENELRSLYIADVSRILRKDLHIVMMNSAGETILAQIFKYGTCIVNRNAKVLTRFKMTAYAMIADFGYYKDLMKKGLARKLGIKMQ
jgi:predicted nucleotidyltransferase